MGTRDLLDPCLTATAREQGQSEQEEPRLKWAACQRQDVQELPHWMHVLQTRVQLEAGCSMLPSQWSTLCALVASQALQLSCSPRQPCWLHCRTGLLPLARAVFLLCRSGFCECLPSPISWAHWYRICYCLCAYALLRLQVVLSSPTLSSFIVFKSEPCIRMPVDTHYTHYRGQLGATRYHPGWDQDHLCSLGTSCYPRTAHWKVAGSKLQAILFSSLQDVEPNNREEEKYPSQRTLSGSSSKRKMLPLCRFPTSMNIWSQEKPGEHSLHWQDPARDKPWICLLPLPQLQAGCCTFWAPMQTFPPKCPGPTLEVRGSYSATRHSYKEWRDSRKIWTNGHCM